MAANGAAPGAVPAGAGGAVPAGDVVEVVEVVDVVEEVVVDVADMTAAIRRWTRSCAAAGETSAMRTLPARDDGCVTVRPSPARAAITKTAAKSRTGSTRLAGSARGAT